MSNSTPKVSILQRVGITQILLYLNNHKNEQVITTQLIKEVDAANDTIIKALDFLEINGLILKEKTKTFPFKHIVKLSPMGEKAAQLLDSLEAVLKEASQ